MNTKPSPLPKAEKKTYKRPEVFDLGSVVSLTAGGSAGARADGVSGMFMISNV